MHKRNAIPLLCFLFLLGMNIYLIQSKPEKAEQTQDIVSAEPVFRNMYQAPTFGVEQLQKAIAEDTEARTFLKPLEGGVITSPFGLRERNDHKGIDLGADTGTPIFASLKGTVSTCGWVDGYGYTVILTHDNGYETLYAHCSTLCTEQNQSVEKGDVIALVGSTGNSTGPHLHFEIIKDGIPEDPALHISF